MLAFAIRMSNHAVEEEENGKSPICRAISILVYIELNRRNYGRMNPENNSSSRCWKKKKYKKKKKIERKYIITGALYV